RSHLGRVGGAGRAETAAGWRARAVSAPSSRFGAVATPASAKAARRPCLLARASVALEVEHEPSGRRASKGATCVHCQNGTRQSQPCKRLAKVEPGPCVIVANGRWRGKAHGGICGTALGCVQYDRARGVAPPSAATELGSLSMHTKVGIVGAGPAGLLLS